MMFFTDIFIRRPVLASVISTLILLIGLKSLMTLQVRQYPELTNTVITITTAYPGASAELMQGLVTSPLQQKVATAQGVEYVTSTSKQSVSTITAFIKLNFSPDVAMTEVIAKVSETQSELPQEAEAPVIIKETGDTIAMMYLAFSSNQLLNEQITDYLKRQILPRLSVIEGVGSAEVLGGTTFAMRVWLNPQKMAGLNISASDVTQALIKNNYQSAPGNIKGYFVASSVEANTDLKNAQEFSNIIIKSLDQKVVRLKDIASIELAAETYNSSVKINDQPAVFIAIKNTPVANPIQVVKAIRSQFPAFERNLPPGLKMDVAYDSTKFIQASIDEVIHTLLEASLIVMVVIFLFLGSLRVVAIPLVTIPLSIIGVFTALLILGFSINLLTLLAMVLAIGLVVDDAIVVVENVHRHLVEGKTPFEAAIQGTREIAVPVVSMTITLMAVYAPIALMGGLTGALFKEFALTLAGAVVISGIVALTLSPMMCSKIMTKDSLSGGFAEYIDHQFEVIKTKYHGILERVLLKPGRILLLSIGLIGISLVFFKMIPQELAPMEDQGFIMTMTKAPQYANIDYMTRYGNELSKQLTSIPEKEMVFVVNGMESPTSGFGAVILKPWQERARSQQTIVPDIQRSIWTIPGISAFAFQMPPLPGGSRGLPVQFVVNGMASYEVIYQVMDQLKTAARQSGLFMVVDSDLAYNNPIVRLKIDHSKANQLGINMEEIGQVLTLMMGEAYVNRFNLEGRGYKVIPLTKRISRLSPHQIGQFYVKTSTGQQIPLSTVASIVEETQPNELYQFNQINSATFQAVLMPWVSLGQGIEFLKKYGEKNLPPGFGYDFLTEARQYIHEGNALVGTFIFALIIIFLVLAAQFESLRDPFIVMLSVPTSIFGATLIMILGATTLNIYSQVGLITLVGLITKHGILMVEFANQLQEEQGLDKYHAIVQAASIRLRPILMTTAAMVVGLIPLILATGAGASSRFSIGAVIIAGMLIGTSLTLFVVPTYYLLLSKPKLIKQNV
jgi:multidrug efflux pump